jgi:NADPH:quinone reductase-like Zn-dependent oxidoreductase
MQAIIQNEYGSPDRLELKEIDRPVVNDDQVLVRVHAASVNPLDWHFMRGTPRFGRLVMGLRKPKNKVLGADMAGRVEAVGKEVTQFQPGDEVIGDSFEHGLGAFAEYVSIAETAIVLKPTGVSCEDPAAMPTAAVTALQGLRDKGKIQPGQKVLINGASDGVGTYAVQIAKSFGAEVTGVCSTKNVEMVRSIGADHVIDYTREDFTQNGQGYDLVIDAVGNRSVSDLKRALSPGGTCVIIGFTSLGLLFQAAFLGAWMSLVGSKKIGLMGSVKPNQKDMDFMKDLVDSGEVTPVIDKRYPLSEVAEAIRYLEDGHVRGKVVITVLDAERSVI